MVDPPRPGAYGMVTDTQCPTIMSRWSRLGLHAALAGTAALGAAVLMPAPEAKAACLESTGTLGSPGYNPCATFNPGTTSVVTDYQDFSGSFGTPTALSPAVQFAQVSFQVSNLSTPFSFDSITLSGPGLIPSPLSFGSVNIASATSFFSSSIISLGSSLSSGNFGDYKLSFSIPGGVVPDGSVIDLDLAFCSASNCTAGAGKQFVSSTRFGALTAEVPGPLPLMGAGVAFGFSRKLRRRISTTS